MLKTCKTLKSLHRFTEISRMHTQVFLRVLFACPAVFHVKSRRRTHAPPTLLPQDRLLLEQISCFMCRLLELILLVGNYHYGDVLLLQVKALEAPRFAVAGEANKSSIQLNHNA